jgi:N-acetylmuramoyl-L-alanine amidase
MSRLFTDDAIATACVWAEARSEPLDGKIAVAEVIRNRMHLGYFSDGSVAGTVFRPWQFSCMNTDNQWRSKIFELDWDSPTVKECAQAWQIAKGGSASVGKAVLYYAEYIAAPRWAKAEGVKLVKQIGRHLFFEDRAA